MPNSGAFRSLHCLIYKVLAAALGGTFAILTHLFRFVKHFFDFFQIFFSALIQTSPELQTALLFYQIISGLSSIIFSFFQTFLIGFSKEQDSRMAVL